MYLTGITAQQDSPPSYDLTCQVRVRWAYGDQMPDVIEFWWQGGSSSNGYPVPPQLSVNQNNPVEEAILTLPAGVPGTVRACPRMVEDAGI